MPPASVPRCSEVNMWEGPAHVSIELNKKRYICDLNHLRPTKIMKILCSQLLETKGSLPLSSLLASHFLAKRL